MTDTEIIKVLKCCTTKGAKCSDCPAFKKVDRSYCKKYFRGAIALINRQKAEIERLNNNISAMSITNGGKGMTCKDCIHYDVCSKKHWHVECNKYACDLNDIENRCDDFKDKSRFIELPCKIGDTVYLVDDKMEIIEYSIINIFFASFNFALWLKVENNDSVKTLLFSHYNQHWFTNKSKAEAKLKELNEKCL